MQELFAVQVSLLGASDRRTLAVFDAPEVAAYHARAEALYLSLCDVARLLGQETLEIAVVGVGPGGVRATWSTELTVNGSGWLWCTGGTAGVVGSGG
jgi:hypothetical protein